MEIDQLFNSGTSSILSVLLGLLAVYFIFKKLIKIAIFAALAFGLYSYLSDGVMPSLAGSAGTALSASSAATSTAKSAAKSLKP